MPKKPLRPVRHSSSPHKWMICGLQCLRAAPTPSFGAVDEPGTPGAGRATDSSIDAPPRPQRPAGVLIKLSNTGLDLIDRAVVAVTDFESSAVGNAIGSDKERLQLENGLRRMLTAHERP